MKKGTVKFFNASQKFGFITCTEDLKDYYVHVKDLLEPVKQGDAVTFEIAPSKRGLQAVKVSLAKAD
ncbi:MAG TPA: cold shock domain-containing protein [Bacteroidia bacterium]|jgi:cold shock CspA family protein|nr:cold shock domain-containing protein [Bacteroidia bacterium]